MIYSKKTLLVISLSAAFVSSPVIGSDPLSDRSARISSEDSSVVLSVVRYDPSQSVSDFIDYETHNENGALERIKVPASLADDIKGVLRHHKNVKRVEIDQPISIPTPPTSGTVKPLVFRDWEGSDTYNDPGFQYQTQFAEANSSHHGASGILEAQGNSRLQKELTVVVADSQFDAHLDFSWDGGHDFVDNDPDSWLTAYDSETCSNYHGQQVGSVIGAYRDSGASIAGIADASYYGARVLGCDGGGSFSDIVDAISWAAGGTPGGIEPIEQTADIINMSLGGATGACSNISGLQSAIDNARASGAIVVAAAGNDGSDTESYSPANCDGVVTVASNDRDGEISSFSNTGSEVDFSALGEGVPVQSSESSFSLLNGTSFSSPNVSGMLALLWKQAPDLDPDSVVSMALDAVTPVQGFSSGSGEGILNATLLFEQAAGLLGDYVVRHPLADTCSESASRSLMASRSGFCDLREIKVDDEFYEPELHYVVFNDDTNDIVAHSQDQRFTVDQWNNSDSYSITTCDDPGSSDCNNDFSEEIDLSQISESFPLCD